MTTNTDCASLGPDGARCQKINGHIGDHGGIDRRGTLAALVLAKEQR